MRSMGCKLLMGASGLMVLGFLIHLCVDYHTYCRSFGSAPFWIWATVDGILWLIPAALALTAGLMVRHKLKNKEKKDDTRK